MGAATLTPAQVSMPSSSASSTSNATSITTSTAPASANPSFASTAALSPLPASSFSPGPLAGGFLLAILAAATLVMARRRRRATRLIEILETASLGPKRALVVARLGDDLLVLGSSEGGIALLSTRPATSLPVRAAQAVPDAEPRPASAPSTQPGTEARPPVAGRVLDLFSRLRPRSRPAPAFEAALTESLEDLELRRKLAAGLAGQAGQPPSGSVR